MRHATPDLHQNLAISLAHSCTKTNNGNNGSGTGNNGNGNGTGGNDNTSLGTGAIYVDWATEGLLKIDLSSAGESTVIANMIPVHNVDISKDNKQMLTCTDAPGTDYNANLITRSNITGATIISQFKYYATDGDFVQPSLPFA